MMSSFSSSSSSSSSSLGGSHQTREKRRMRLALLFIASLSCVTILSRIWTTPKVEFLEEFRGDDERTEEEEEEEDDINAREWSLHRAETNEDDGEDLGGRNGRLRRTPETRKCTFVQQQRQREDQHESEEKDERVQKSWIFRTNAKRLGYVHMASIMPIENGKILLAAWQGAHKVEGTDDQSVFVSKSVDGGEKWTKPRVVPGRTFGVRWAPTFFSSSSGSNEGETYLFYAESEQCWHCESNECEDIVRKRKNGSEEEDVSTYWDDSKEGIVSKAKKAASVGPWWRPGGNIKRVSIRLNDIEDDDGDINDDPWTFGEEEMILNEEAVPKVIGNPLLKLDDAILLPFWREHPRADAKCQPRKASDYASVLHSLDNGYTFHETHAKIEHRKNKMKDGKPDWLIEGSIVGPLRDGRLAQFFRTSRGAIYVSHSADNGESWDTPHATPLQNPNSKVSAVLLPNGVVVVCHNAHAFMKHPRIGVTRGKLALSVSTDDGKTWKEAVLFIEDTLEPGKHIHYPTMVIDGCDLRISYSVSGEGVKLATVKDWVSLHEVGGDSIDEQRVVY